MIVYFFIEKTDLALLNACKVGFYFGNIVYSLL